MADIGAGTQIGFGTSGFTATVEDVNLASITRNDVEITHMGSPTTTAADSHVQVWQEFIPGAANAGELSYDIQYDPDATIPVDGDTETITVTHRSTATFVCDGYISGCSVVVPVQDKMAATITVKYTGDPAWSPA